MQLLSEAFRAPFIDDLCKLVRMPSRSFPAGGEEGELQRWVAARMRAKGPLARVRCVEADDVPEFRKHPLCCGPERNYKDRPTVIAEIGPADAPALLVAAHSDTVPINQFDEWTFSPFLGEVRNGMVCGLGANDDKWGTAVMLTVLRALVESGRPLRKRVIFVSTIDEENGVGNGLLLATLAGVRAEAGLYLDGCEMSVAIGNSGGSNLCLRPKSRLDEQTLRAHGERLKAAAAELSARREALFNRPYFEHSSVRKNSVVFRRRAEGEAALLLLAFYTVPGEAKTDVCRQIESAASRALGAELAGYALSYREPWFEPALMDAGAPIVGLMAESVRTVAGREPLVTVIPKQDVFILHNHAKIPTVSFGISRLEGRGGYHQPDESAPVEDAWIGCRVAHHAVSAWLEQT